MRTRLLALMSLSLVFFPNAIAQTSLQTGYIRVVPDEGTVSPAGVAIFGQRIGGVLVSEASVPATTTLQSGRIFVDADGPVNTGIALANPSFEDVTVTFYFTDSGGRDFGAGAFTLPAMQQIAAFLDEQPFGLKSLLEGTFTFNSSKPVAAIALRSFVNERNEVLMTTLPVLPVGRGLGGSAVVIPQIVEGGGWNTQIVLINPGETSLVGKVRFFAHATKSGSAPPVRVVVNGVTDSTFEYTVPSHSAVRMRTQPAQQNEEVGSVEIVPAATSAIPSSLAIFSYQNDGTTVSAASVSALPPAKALRMYVESAGTFGSAGSIQTGLAIANPSQSRVAVQLEVLKLDGTPAGLSTSVDIVPTGHITKFVNELFPGLPSPFRGVLKISAPTPVVVTGLRARYNERADLLMTTTPPHDDAMAPASEISFPHFVNGAGYFTELILISTDGPQSGGLWLMSKDGVPLPDTTLQSN